ncbi:AraC family transcriptional regulator ligand-binding domain-containing protein [Nocardioides caeni]|uniref:AraC family transcriptional regulator n=1 Tax=Nocardioides caeni TaxID=574700 RepID=A0A4S8MZA1_9ACTN|nr:AraC family transcriptional regulator [Nocardioides caeni]THV08807.1 AraC family transcriptional regulator [Nocardioides caeni]
MSPTPGFEEPATRTWTFPRSVAGVALLLEEGRAAGLDPDVLLRGSGLAPRDAADHEREITAEQELRVVRNLLAGAPGLTGRSVGARYHASTFGPLGFALLSSATLGDAANLALRFIDLSFAFSIPSAERVGDSVVVTLAPAGLPRDVARFLVERDLTAIWHVLREIGGGRPVATAIEVDAATGSARLRFDTAWLDLPLPQANPHACALAESICRDLVRQRRARVGIDGNVRILAAQHLEDGAPMEVVAAGLGLSERTLRRRLGESGASYRSVVDDVRRQRADELLADDTLTVADIALRLGYAEATSFGAAYRRWTGRTPRGRG